MGESLLVLGGIWVLPRMVRLEGEPQTQGVEWMGLPLAAMEVGMEHQQSGWGLSESWLGSLEPFGVSQKSQKLTEKAEQMLMWTEPKLGQMMLGSKDLLHPCREWED